MLWKYFFFHPLHVRKYIFLSLMNKLTHSFVLARKNSRHQMINLRQKRFGKANLKFYTITYISFMFNAVRHVTLIKRRLCEFVFTKRKTLTRSESHSDVIIGKLYHELFKKATQSPSIWSQHFIRLSWFFRIGFKLGTYLFLLRIIVAYICGFTDNLEVCDHWREKCNGQRACHIVHY